MILRANAALARHWIHSAGAALIILASVGSVVLAMGPEEVTSAARLYDQYFKIGTSHFQNVQNLSEAQRDLLTLYLRSRIEEKMSKGRSSANTADSFTLLNLALLGDVSARNEVVKTFWISGSALGLHYLKEPKVLAMIGNGLFMEDKYYKDGDLGHMPIQDKVAEVFIDTMGNSPEFSADVINWARRVEHSTAGMGNLEWKIVREWYRANEARLQAGDFKAVQPGPEPPERMSTKNEPVHSHSFISTPAPVIGTHMQENSGNKYAWIAALLLAVCGGLIWLLKRKKT